MFDIRNWPLKVKVLLLIAVSVLYVNVFLVESDISTEDQARNAVLSGNHVTAKGLYERLLEDDPLNIDWHRKKIRANYNSRLDDKDAIVDEYVQLSTSEDSEEADVGFYALGFISAVQDNNDATLKYYLRVSNQDLPFLNNSIGYIYLEQEKLAVAEPYFVKETELNHNVSSAYLNLARFYHETKQTSQVGAMLDDSEKARFVPYTIKRSYYLETGQPINFLKHAIKLGNYTSKGLGAALLLTVIWLAFLKFIDVFEPEKTVHLLLAFFLACVISLFTLPIYALFEHYLDFKLNGDYLNDLLFCILGIGLIEEAIKLIPFLIILRFKSVLNESVDYIVYASVCGLGFGFMENLHYFHEGGLQNITSRAVTSSVLHMALTSLVAYGLFYADYVVKRDRWFFGALAFAAACIIHGVYDYWLIVDFGVSELKLLSIFILALTIVGYSRMIVNTLNFSTFNTGKTETIFVFEYLTLALTALAIYQYLSIATEFGVMNANYDFAGLLLSTSFLALIVVGNLGAFKITKGGWEPYFRDDNS